MKHEFKIVVKYDDEGNCDSPIILVDENPIGCIQDLKFAVNCSTLSAKIAITFPDLSGLNSSFEKEIKMYLENLGKIPGMTLLLQKTTIYQSADDLTTLKLEEVGTDGTIDHIHHFHPYGKKNK
jgi:hypothetical protein